MQPIALPSSAADTSRRFGMPIAGASHAVSPGPTIAPRLPPAEMKPKSRRAASVANTSAMKLQNTDTTNRLNTLTQTKNAGASARNGTPDSSAT